jgi:hypothetical protein
MIGLFLASVGMAADSALSTTPLPKTLVGVDMYKDGGTLRLNLLDEQNAPLRMYIDGRFISPTPGAIYLNAYPADSDSILIPQDSALASALLGVLKQWLKDNYTEEQLKQLPTASPTGLTQKDFQAKSILNYFDFLRRTELKNEKAQQSVPGYPPQGVGSPEP